ncbi:MAG: hypothetical protein HY666_01645 [Chloroflexi bacterium]|nr:hypothetical protein [Chloroflexota bacterium]
MQLPKAANVLWLAVVSLTLALNISGCSEAPLVVSSEAIKKLGFDPSTVKQKHSGKIGVPGLPDGFTYKEVVSPGEFDEPDVIALDPTEKFLYFVTKGEYPDSSVYRVDLVSGEIMRLATGLHRLGGITYYQPGNVLIVGEEGTGIGPTENKLGFWYGLRPDVVDQPTPPPLRAMGQYRAEGIEPVGADTIYLGEDQPHGGYVYKYVLDSPPDLTRGTLFVLKENEGWIKTNYLEAPDTGKEGTKFYAAEDMHMGPDGKLYLVISAEAENRVVAIDPITAKVTDFVSGKTKGFRRPDQLAFSPSGVLFITEDVDVGDIWAALPDGPDEDSLSDGVYRFLTGLPYIQGIVFTKDGTTFYVAQKGDVDSIIAISGFKYP